MTRLRTDPLRAVRLAALALAVGCGGGGPNAQVRPTAVDVAVVARAPAQSAPSTPPEPEIPERPAGANGPHDAREMIGDAGALEVAPHRATLLVNSAAARSHPSAKIIAKMVTDAFPGWQAFVPNAILRPLDDFDWMLASGSFMWGSTEKNVFLARYRLSETEMDARFGMLLHRLPLATPWGAQAEKTFSAPVDHAERWYFRPKDHVFAIVPRPDSARATAILEAANVPESVRAGELFRITYSAGPTPTLFLGLPRGMRRLRMWAQPDGPGIVLHAEADCDDAESAERVAHEFDGLVVKTMSHGIVRASLGSVAQKLRFWPDGSTARAKVKLTEEEIERVGMVWCMIANGGMNGSCVN